MASDRTADALVIGCYSVPGFFFGLFLVLLLFLMLGKNNESLVLDLQVI